MTEAEQDAITSALCDEIKEACGAAPPACVVAVAIRLISAAVVFQAKGEASAVAMAIKVGEEIVEATIHLVPIKAAWDAKREGADHGSN